MLEQTTDADFIRKSVVNARVWPWVQDGGNPADYVPVLAADVIYLRNGDAGVFAFKRINQITWECHSFMATGRGADDAGKAAIKWMFERTEAQKLMCLIPSGTRHAVAFARRVGFREEGRLQNAALRNRRLQDLILLGVSKWAAQ